MTARRAALVLVLVVLGTTAQLSASGSAGGPPTALVAEGADLYAVACTSCHGADGEGVEGRGPSLAQAGAASADFYLSSGRMPMDDPQGQTQRKPPAYAPEEIDALVAFVATLGEGPAIPDTDPQDGDLPTGQQLYTANCAACHNSAGSGGALGQSIYAPAVTDATLLQVAEATRIGPGAMPAFGPGTLDDEEVASIQRYVGYLKDPRDPGGAPLGRLGPVPEGAVAWLVGVGSLLVVARWLGAHR